MKIVVQTFGCSSPISPAANVRNFSTNKGRNLANNGAFVSDIIPLGVTEHVPNGTNNETSPIVVKPGNIVEVRLASEKPRFFYINENDADEFELIHDGSSYAVHYKDTVKLHSISELTTMAIVSNDIVLSVIDNNDEKYYGFWKEVFVALHFNTYFYEVYFRNKKRIVFPCKKQFYRNDQIVEYASRHIIDRNTDLKQKAIIFAQGISKSEFLAKK